MAFLTWQQKVGGWAAQHGISLDGSWETIPHDYTGDPIVVAFRFSGSSHSISKEQKLEAEKLGIIVESWGVRALNDLDAH